MSPDDVFFPYLLKLFAEYLEDMEFSTEEARLRGSEAFAGWLKELFPEVSPAETYGDEEEEEEETTERTPEGDALFVLLSFLQADPSGAWGQEFWGSLLITQRNAPRHSVAEVNISYLIRWADDRLFSFVCVLPPHMIKPKGVLSDYLVTKIGSLSAMQFHDMIAERPLDLLHDVQQLKIPKGDIEEVLRRTVSVVSEEPNARRREDLQNAIHLMRSMILPPLPPEAELEARQAMTGNSLTGGSWEIFPSEEAE